MIVEAIFKINPKAKFSVNNGNDINNYTVEWLDGTTPISKAEIEAQIPIVEFEIAMKYLRNKRNKALADSDWTVLTDVPLEPAQKAAWMNYRTLLRNITNGLITVEQIKSTTLPLPPK
jgi:propanediol dehydratase large subunit